jgi:hypothetical protein
MKIYHDVHFLGGEGRGLVTVEEVWVTTKETQLP